MANDANAEIQDIETRLRREVALQARQAQLARNRMHELESMREAMQDTLMNHKREVLMEHKVLSTNIQQELAKVEEDKAQADKQCVHWCCLGHVFDYLFMFVTRGVAAGRSGALFCVWRACWLGQAQEGVGASQRVGRPRSHVGE